MIIFDQTPLLEVRFKDRQLDSIRVGRSAGRLLVAGALIIAISALLWFGIIRVSDVPKAWRLV